MKYRQADFVRFLESTLNGNKWKVAIVEEGISLNRAYYSEEVLRKSAPLFEKTKVNFYEFDKKFFNHLPPNAESSFPQGFPLQTAGFLEDVQFEEFEVDGKKKRGLTGYISFLETEKATQLKKAIVSAWKKGVRNFIGLSINADGKSVIRMLKGIPVQFVKSIDQVLSTEFVSHPSAGGGLLRLIESVNDQGGNLEMFKKLLQKLKTLKPKLFEKLDFENITEDEAIGIFQSFSQEYKDTDQFAAAKNIASLVKEKKFEDAEKAFDEFSSPQKSEPVSEPSPESSPEPSSGSEPSSQLSSEDILKRQEKLEQKAQLRECSAILRERLSESKLPQAFKDKVRKQFEGKVFQESDLDNVIKSETETLSRFAESEQSFDIGDFELASVRSEPVDRIQASLDLMFDPQLASDESQADNYEGIEAFTSLREAYVAFTDDPNISGMMGKKAVRRLQEADSTTFNYALGFSMQRRMLREYKMIEMLWRKIASVVPIKDFKLQERIRWGGFGQLPQVLAARTVAGTPIDSTTPTYPELGFPQDQEATYAVSTKGGIVTLTRRMIIDDDLNILMKVPAKLARAAGNTLNRFVFDLMLNVSSGTINGGTIYDSIALYATAHKNLRTGVLTHDNLKNLLDDMYHQVEFGNQTLSAGSDDFDTDATTTTVNVTAGTGQYFKDGDMLWCEGEIMLVDSVSTDAITITRGLFGTTAATHADGSTIYKVTEILALENPYLWVPRTLRSTALALKNSQMNPETAENEVNTVRDSFDPIVSQFLRGNEANYYLSARPEDIEGIEIGFLQGREEPEILVQDQPTVGNVFLYDTIRYKVRHEYGGTVVDFRAFAASIPS